MYMTDPHFPLQQNMYVLLNKKKNTDVLLSICVIQ